MSKEELIFKLSLLEQQSNQLEQQIQQVDSQIQEFLVLQDNLKNLKETKEKKQILAPIGRGVFSKVELKEDKFFVNVGSGIIIKKTGEDANKIIQEQVSQLKNIRQELIEAIIKINSELEKVVEQANKEK